MYISMGGGSDPPGSSEVVEILQVWAFQGPILEVHQEQ